MEYHANTTCASVISETTSKRPNFCPFFLFHSPIRLTILGSCFSDKVFPVYDLVVEPLGNADEKSHSHRGFSPVRNSLTNSSPQARSSRLYSAPCGGKVQDSVLHRAEATVRIERLSRAHNAGQDYTAQRVTLFRALPESIHGFFLVGLYTQPF